VLQNYLDRSVTMAFFLVPVKPEGNRAIKQISNIKQGVTDIDDVPTKHYLKEELELLLTLEGFEVTQVTKINYGWNTEFHKPPKWLKGPYPWDWMCTAKKLG
jgi:hypothetical protein